MTARWAEALDTQLDAWRWYRDERGQRELRAFSESYLSKMVDPKQDGLSPDELRQVTEVMFASDGPARSMMNLIEAVPAMLWAADPIYVDPDMMPLVESAWSSWKPEALLETDMLIPAGFLILPRALYVRDIHGKSINLRAFTWWRTPLQDVVSRDERMGCAFAMFSDSRVPDDYPLPSPEYIRSRGTTLSLMHITPWAFGDDPGHFVGNNGMHTGIELVQCVLRLMAQTIAVRSERNAPRETNRRLLKAEFPARRITVVTLRRPDGERKEGEPGDVEWSHRWIVDGHWRQQWYPSLGMHRQIWISPYVKGPTDLPLVIPKAHVYQFVR